MQRGLSLTELARKIEAQRDLKHDFIASTELMGLEPDDDGVMKLLVPEATESFPMLGTAHDQIGLRTGIPGRYYDRMLKEQPQLLATNVNTWFHANPQKRMIRTLGGDVRAFLSNRYQRIDNEEIAEVALPILGGIPDVRFVSTEVTDRRMYIQAVSPRVEGEVKVGDAVQAGVIISNSEIGYGSVMVAPMIWRLACLNGMVCADKFRAYHVGRQIEDSADLWADDTRQADDRAILLKVRDMVTAAVDQTAFKERLEQMRSLTDTPRSRAPDRSVEVLARKCGATNDERSGILAALVQGGDLTAWGFLNAVTAQAHEAVSYERAVEFEVAGGKLLELSRSEWSEILDA